ncbi:MAG TPA: Fic family protein [Pseudobdellovibrionaceae bacterium]|nr:Fic family protein [Pseudobdellovibrionaceae bacterium]
MKVRDLHPKLQKRYPNDQGYGIVKGLHPEISNIWFVVPKALDRLSPTGIKIDLLREAHATLKKLPSIDELKGRDRLILSLLVRREAVQSSRMEGTFSTIDQVLTPLSEFTNREKSARSSVIAYASVLEKALEISKKKGSEVFTKKLLRELHKEMMRWDPHFMGKPGLFRNEIENGVYVRIGGFRFENSIYNPTPPEYIQLKIAEHLSWLTDQEGLELSRAGMAPGLMVRLARGHWHFEAIHPFTDGNGRVGRMLMMLQMVTEGIVPLYLSGFIEANKQNYYLALNKAQSKLDEAPLVNFLCEAVIESFKEVQKTKQAIFDLENKWQKIGQFRQKSGAERLLPFILEYPVLTVKLVQEKLKISQPAAKRAIDQLQKLKILNERTGQVRNRLFASEEILELLARPFGEPVELALARSSQLTIRKR